MKRFTISITGNEYNAIAMALGTIGGRAFGASKPKDGIDPLKVVGDMAVEACRKLGPEGVAELMSRMGDAAQAAYGAEGMTTNARDTPFAHVVPFRNSDLQ